LLEVDGDRSILVLNHRGVRSTRREVPPMSVLPSSAPTSALERLPPLRSVHTTSFADLLDQFGISLLVTTYQAGKLVMLRADNGVVNTHFRSFPKPMGLALHGNRLAIGTALEV